jgi:HK97 gp10 family phage protein
VKISYKYDDRGFSRHLKAISHDVDRMLEAEIAAAARRTAQNAKSFAPVAQSGLKTSIRTMIKGKTGETIVGVGYGAYVEFGTGSKVNVPSELKEYAMQFKGAGIRDVNTWAQPYLYPAFFTQRDRLNKIVDDQMEKIFKKHSR